jgi:rhodanese-related sulfurtransferase
MEVSMNFLSKLFGASVVPSVDPAEAQARLGAQPKPFLLDVRNPDEYRAGHIPGATLIPLPELQGRSGELPKDGEIICVCQSGHRSSTATSQLVSAGFKAVSLTGGMNAWSRQGLPVKKGSAR